MTNLINENDLFNTSEHETVSLLGTYCEINRMFKTIRGRHPGLKNHSNEKILQLLAELFVASVAGDILDQDFKVFISPYREAIDAVGEDLILQIKIMGGYGNNSKKFNMKPGMRVDDYIFKMETASDSHRALLVVANTNENEVCICPAFSFCDDRTTYISWKKMLKADGVKVYELPDLDEHYLKKAALLLEKATILAA